MFESIRKNKTTQRILGLLMGIVFGFLLQRGGVTRYDVIIGQLLLKDWTVVKIILTAVAVGMVGVYAMNRFGWVKLHRKPGSFGATVIGGLIFGIGFGVLGYCPGTLAGAVAQGSMDALFGGMIGMLFGTAVYAVIYPRLRGGILKKGEFGDITFPELCRVNVWVVVPIAVVLIVGFLYLLERIGC